jgi:hypothetical protein
MEDQMQLLLGSLMVIGSIVAFCIALPRGGQVVNFLRRDSLQSCYVALMLAAFVTGWLIIAASVGTLDANTGYQ